MKQFQFQDKRILFIIKVCALAGAERQALGLSKYLKENYNCEIEFVATHSNEQTNEFKDFAEFCGVSKIHYFGVPSLAIKPGWTYANLKKTIRAYRYLYIMKSRVKKLKPDVIIPYMNFASKLSSLIYQYVGAKHTFWHELGEADNYYYDILEKRAIKKAPFFCANSKGGFKTFNDTYQVNPEKCHLLTQYVSFERVNYNKTDINKELGIPDNKLVYGMIAHYRDQKHHDLLIEAFANMSINKGVHLVFLGNQNNDKYTLEKYDNLVELTKSYGIENKVTFLSNVKTEKVLSIIDIGVLVSDYEGAPTVLMEYMLYGKPIIATNHVGCRLLMGDSEFLVPKNNVEVLSEKMVKLYNDSDLRSQIGKKHIEIIKKYNIKNYCNTLEGLFEKYL